VQSGDYFNSSIAHCARICKNLEMGTELLALLAGYIAFWVALIATAQEAED
jgi:hypothetical protein